MKIVFRRRYLKDYAKLTAHDRGRVDRALARFRFDPHAPELKNHGLQGKLAGKRAISAGYDLRIVFEERDGYAVVLLLKVGGHDKAYR